jgi:hypothetical protein
VKGSRVVTSDFCPQIPRERVRAEAGRLHPERLQFGCRGHADELAADLPAWLALPLEEDDPEPGSRQPGGRRCAGGTSADHQHIGYGHRGLIRPTA